VSNYLRKIEGDGGLRDIQVKVDGSPAIIFGTHPDTNRFFVATKSFWNKTPKVNYTDDDIERNHKGELGEILKRALFYLPKIFKPSAYGAVYQGDLMFSTEAGKSILEIDGVRHVTFKPNTLMYAFEEGAKEFDDILAAKFGIVIHSVFTGNSYDTLRASNLPRNPKMFKKSRVVWWATNHLNMANSGVDGDFLNRLDSELNSLEKIKPTYLQEVPEYIRKEFLVYINSKIRTAGDDTKQISLNVDDFREWIATRAGKDPKLEAFSWSSRDVSNIRAAISLWEKLSSIKNSVVRQLEAIARTKAFNVSPDGSITPASPEGFVVVDSAQKIVKFVNRLGFSRQNFQHGAMQALKRRTSSSEPISETRSRLRSRLFRESKPSRKIAILSYGRFQPITRGHGVLFDSIIDTAKKIGADAYLGTSKNQKDPLRNPLQWETKVKAIKSRYGNSLMVIPKDASITASTAIKWLIDAGYEEIRLAAGDDREEDFQRMTSAISSDTGVDVRILKTPARGDVMVGGEAISGSLLRKFALSGDYASFKAGFLGGIPDSVIKDAYEEIIMRASSAETTPTTKTRRTSQTKKHEKIGTT
jgi:hypothetical protein